MRPAHHDQEAERKRHILEEQKRKHPRSAKHTTTRRASGERGR